MKWNCYDLFDYYDAKAQGMPKLQTEAVDMDAVKKRIYARVDIEPQTQRSHGRLWKRVAAGVAAVTALSIGCNLLSVAAGYDGIHAFFESLFIEQTPVSPEAMESLVSTPQVSSDSTSGDVQFTLLGMYGDQSQAMLSFQVTAQDGVELIVDETSPLVTYAVVQEDGMEEQLSYAGETCTLHASETGENQYVINLFLADLDLQGKRLDLTFQNFYTSRQIQAVSDTVQETQNEWRNDYILETYGADALDCLADGELPDVFSVDDWKAYWNEQNYDALTQEQYDALYADSDCAVAGVWHAEIPLNFTVADPINAVYDGGEITLQTLSAQISHDADLCGDDQMVVYELMPTDGRLISTDDSADGETDAQRVTITHYATWNDDKTVETEILCYEELIDPQEIAEITMTQYTLYIDEDAPEESGWVVTDEQVIYTVS
ncbi:MAG: hypothetical protein LUC50_04780 [Ruminococcus sp.]|nr:hypothetical protein [Ruminococcus sp.]